MFQTKSHFEYCDVTIENADTNIAPLKLNNAVLKSNMAVEYAYNILNKMI